MTAQTAETVYGNKIIDNSKDVDKGEHTNEADHESCEGCPTTE